MIFFEDALPIRGRPSGAAESAPGDPFCDFRSDGAGTHDVEVVTVLRPSRYVPLRHSRVVRISRWATSAAWAMAALDCMTVAWMMTAGRWLDRQHDLLSMMTWDGHHVALMVAAACSLAVLAVTAPLTRGFAEGPPLLVAAVIVASFTSMAVIAGVLALVLPAAILGFAIGVIGRLLR